MSMALNIDMLERMVARLYCHQIGSSEATRVSEERICYDAVTPSLIRGVRRLVFGAGYRRIAGFIDGLMSLVDMHIAVEAANILPGLCFRLRLQRKKKYKAVVFLPHGRYILKSHGSLQ